MKEITIENLIEELTATRDAVGLTTLKIVKTNDDTVTLDGWIECLIEKRPVQFDDMIIPFERLSDRSEAPWKICAVVAVQTVEHNYPHEPDWIDCEEVLSTLYLREAVRKMLTLAFEYHINAYQEFLGESEMAADELKFRGEGI